MGLVKVLYYGSTNMLDANDDQGLLTGLVTTVKEWFGKENSTSFGLI